jgi:plastocyanin
VTDGGTIAGVCRLDRDAPTWEVERNKDLDKGCGPAAKHPTERLVVGEGRGVGNCVVFLRSIARGKDWPPEFRGEERSRFVDQKACRYVPHVTWARTGTQLAVGNSDLAEHNIHGYRNSLETTQFNFSTKPQSKNEGEEASFLEKPGAYILKCDIHAWMSGYVHVFPHPYVEVTSHLEEGGRKPGAYALADVPPGEYEVVCWHEGMTEEPVVAGGRIASYRYSPDWTSAPVAVRVEAGKTATVDFTVPGPP